MSIFCRLCAETKDAFEIVTSINDPGRLVEQKLIACCQWNPQNTDLELPQDVCEYCFYKLENSWSFLQSVHKAQRKIQNLFGKRCERLNSLSELIAVDVGTVDVMHTNSLHSVL